MPTYQSASFLPSKAGSECTNLNPCCGIRKAPACPSPGARPPPSSGGIPRSETPPPASPCPPQSQIRQWERQEQHEHHQQSPPGAARYRLGAASPALPGALPNTKPGRPEPQAPGAHRWAPTQPSCTPSPMFISSY